MATKKKSAAVDVDYGLTEDQIKELHELAEALKASEKVAKLRKRFEAFRDDHIEELLKTIRVDGMKVFAKISKTLCVVEEEEA